MFIQQAQTRVLSALRHGVFQHLSKVLQGRMPTGSICNPAVPVLVQKPKNQYGAVDGFGTNA
jgi:hypothetical protein